MPAWPARSTTSWFAGSTAIPPAPGGWSSIRELVEELFAGEEAWIVGGAVRDEALDRPIVDVDVAVAAPERAARRYARASGGAPFPLSERHGAWRVALDDGRTVDFTPLTGPIEDDLATRDFSINAIAERAGTGESVDPFNGYDDLAAKRLRAIGEAVLRADPPANDSPRAIHRFRRATEPWALEALAFLGARGFDDAVIRDRETEPRKPLVRGGELELPPGPEVGRLLEEIAEERAAGTITTKEEALEYARRNTGSVRSDG